MPLTEQDRIVREMTRPRILQLWEALQPLKTIVSFMNSGAHPDDETSAMLAALRFRDGVALSFACANRGEGGQNDIGLEGGADLGALRTMEMERAADRLDMRVYWLSQSPEDSIFDFGFSKSGAETLEIWGAGRTLARMVEILRTERPDVLCPTFLDIPGQHGHHRAMTQTAQQAVDAAADPDYPECDLPVWRVRKVYLPAWSGAGRSYDDDVPPPPATITVPAKGVDPVSGWSWERIAQQSRACHKTQGMGSWIPAGQERDFPLHLATTAVLRPDQSVFTGLHRTLADLADLRDADQVAPPLRAAQSAIDDMLVGFPDDARILARGADALRAIREAKDVCPRHLRDEIQHRLERKDAQLSRVLRIAAGVDVIGRVDRDWLRPGETTEFVIETRAGAADGVSVSVEMPAQWEAAQGSIGPLDGAEATDPYRDTHDPCAPPSPALVVGLDAGGMKSETRLPLETTPVVLPDRTARLSPSGIVLNSARSQRSFAVGLSEVYPESAAANLDLPDGWTATRTRSGFELECPEETGDGLYELPLLLDGQRSRDVRRIQYPHIGQTARCMPAGLKVRVLSVEVPDARIGYLGSGNDRVGEWLAAIGADVLELSDADLEDQTVLNGLDTLVIGIFALKFRPAIVAALPEIHAWVEAGGNLLTLYHRPWDNWDPATTPPRPLQIGQPSLRWRVTDKAAAVTMLAPDNALLRGPNKIGPADWDGWDKERGLYFASSWDDAYVPLLEMADPGEAPHRGALLSANVGRGRHTHCALILHHQMDRLVGGAFRLMANLVAPVR